MSKTQANDTEATPHRFDVRRVRADTLSGVIALAKKLLTPKSKLISLHVTCSQLFVDEAHDAVHSSMVASKAVIPTASDRAAYDRVPHELRDKHVGWDQNGVSIYAFAPLCNEEGWNEARGDEADEAAYADITESALIAVHRVGGRFRPVWLGSLHRPWLDFPAAMKNRHGAVGEGPDFAVDPPMPALVGKEPELYAQVLADPADLGSREVLRDVWLQRDDVRGEFTALSMHDAKPTEAMRERAAELVLAHGRSWLGPLQTVVPLSGALFGNGPFVKSAVVYGDAKAFAKVATAQAWATVECLQFANQSHRLVTPAMKNLRAVGPLSVKELAPLETGSWRVTDLEVELAKTGIGPLAKLTLPLTQLRLRAPGALDLSPLAKASWWSTLRRVELWLPGGVDDAPRAIARAFARLAPQLPRDCTLGVGQLSGGYRSGWLVSGTAKKHTLELQRPDARIDQGRLLAKAMKARLPTTWTFPDEDWLTFGLGVSAKTKHVST